MVRKFGRNYNCSKYKGTRNDFSKYCDGYKKKLSPDIWNTGGKNWTYEYKYDYIEMTAKGFEAPVIKTYSLESTIAEKFDAILHQF